MNLRLLAISAICSPLLSACGGGGGGSAPGTNLHVVQGPPLVAGPVVATVAIDSEISDLYTSPHHFDRSETDPATGNVYNVVADFAVGQDAVIEGVNTKSATVRRVVTKNGAPFQASSETRYFQVAPYKLIAVQSLDTPLYLLASAQKALPATAQAGQSDAFYNANVYESAQKQTVLSMSTYKWEVTPDPADVAASLTFCINSVTTIPGVSGSSSNSECYKVKQPGIVTGVGFTLPR